MNNVNRPVFKIDVTSWDFNIFELSADDLYYMGSDIMHVLSIPTSFDVVERNFQGLMSNVRYYMTRNKLSYHNYFHALDVMQTCCSFITSFELGRFLTDLEVFCLEIAAVCHDLDHPGFTNAYLNNSESRLSLSYNDTSTLENMHASLCFSIMRKDGCDVFSEVEKANRQQARKLIISTIINTDMTYHFSLISDLNECVGRIVKTEKEMEMGGAMEGGDLTVGDSDREIILKSLLHVADISNPCKPWELSKEWSDRVLVEFFHQGDVEKEEGLAVSMNMDRDTTDQAELSLNFCDFIVAPFFLALIGIAPKMITVVMVMDDNRKEWDKLHAEHLKEKNKSNCERYTEDVARWEKRRCAFNKTLEKNDV